MSQNQNWICLFFSWFFSRVFFYWIRPQISMSTSLSWTGLTNLYLVMNAFAALTPLIWVPRMQIALILNTFCEISSHFIYPPHQMPKTMAWFFLCSHCRLRWSGAWRRSRRFSSRRPRSRLNSTKRSTRWSASTTSSTTPSTPREQRSQRVSLATSLISAPYYRVLHLVVDYILLTWS